MTPLTLALIFGAIALTLFLADVFLPSHGILTAGGLLATLIAVVFCFAVNVRLGFAVAAGVIILSPFALMGALRLYPHTPIGRRMTLRAVATDATAPSPTDANLRPGLQGVAISDLRPIGMVDFQGVRIEAYSDRGHLPRNTPVIITNLQNNRPTVRPANDSLQI